MAQEGRAVAVFFAAVLLAPRVAADDVNKDVATALFDDGVKLLEEARCDDENVPSERWPKCRDALDKFRRAFVLYPAGLGALRNAAFCERGLGMIASAMRDFREVARRAPLDPNPSKQLWAKHAAEEADKLQKLVPHLVVRAKDAPPGATVTLDGGALGAAAFDTAIPIDPGEHVVEARAPERLPFRKVFAIAPQQDVTIDVILSPPPPPPPPPPPKDRTVPFVLLGVGGGALLSAAALGFAAKSVRDDACDVTTRPLRCHDEAGLERARSLANVGSIVGVVGGGLFFAGGALLLFGGGPSKSPSAWVTPLSGGVGLAASGAF